MSVEIDLAPLQRAASKLADGLDHGGRALARKSADETADRIRSGVPRRTGRLAGTVTVTSDGDAYGVHYGGGLPYADYIESRSGAVADGTEGADTTFERDAQRLAETEVSRL